MYRVGLLVHERSIFGFLYETEEKIQKLLPYICHAS